jgi:hypothetical protein
VSTTASRAGSASAAWITTRRSTVVSSINIDSIIAEVSSCQCCMPTASEWQAPGDAPPTLALRQGAVSCRRLAGAFERMVA